MSSPDSERHLVEIAVPLPVYRTFTYGVPGAFRGLRIGMRALVPFGKRRLSGYAVGFPEKAELKDVKDILDIIDEEPLFGETDLRFYLWAARYYCYPPGQAIKAALPQGLTVTYQQVFSITPAGRERSQLRSVSERERAVLQHLAERPCTVKTLERHIGVQGLQYTLSTLKKHGWVTVDLRRKAQSVTIKKEKWYVPASECSGPLRGKQKAVMEFISLNRPSSGRQLRQHFGSCSTQINALIKKGFITQQEQELYRRPAAQETTFIEPLNRLSEDQQAVVAQLDAALARGSYYPVLLEGVTGSGKTEVYLQIIARVLGSGRQCLYMVPEIALTVQLLDRIRSRLNVPVAMLHSSLTPAERYDTWRLIRRGEVNVVLGARSSVFASFKDLGIIVVDEEHDHSYKQDDGFCYNARDLAMLKATYAGCMVILGSATPSLESYHNVLTGKYSAAALPRRVENRTLPRVAVIDMKAEPKKHRKKAGIISRYLLQALEQRLDSGHQSILFLNRRGFSTTFICQSCGYAYRCKNCDVPLIHHKQARLLCCHYCGQAMRMPDACPSCGSFFLASLGWGTERLESEVQHLLPKARIARMDRDTASKRSSIHRMLQQMYHREIDILIGTQMIIKGYHLPEVTLVGAVCADQSLNIPDYRAAERTFQILTQVAGRAGRGAFNGEVIIQSYNPEHYSIQCAKLHDFHQFYEKEIRYRDEVSYPPCGRLINIRLEGAFEQKVVSCSEAIGRSARAMVKENRLQQTVSILGPAQAPWSRLKGKYRYHILLKGNHLDPLRRIVTNLLLTHKQQKAPGVTVTIDVDPLFIM